MPIIAGMLSCWHISVSSVTVYRCVMSMW
jgi:hypothetical protein